MGHVMEHNLEVLLVEDDAETARRIIRYFQGKGYKQIIAISDGWRALEKLKEQKFDFIISGYNYNLSDMNGIVFLDHLRKLPDPLSKIPTVIFSGMNKANNKRVIDSAKDLGALDWFMKGNTEDLARLERTLLKQAIQKAM